MCVVTFCGRVIIVILNIIFVIISFVMLVAGIVLKFFSGNEFVKSAESEMKSLIKNAMDTASVGDTNSVENFSLTEALGGLGIALIVIGAFFLIISVFGLVGGCCKFKIILIIYAVIVGVLLVTQIISAIILLATDIGSDAIKKQLKENSLKNYKGLSGINLDSFAWNGVMMKFKCCGVDNYQEFKTYAVSWQHTGIQIYGSGSHNIDMPLACCKTLSSSAAPSCAQTSSSENYKDVGCYDEIWRTSVANPAMTSIVLIAAFAFQLLLIIFSILIYREQNKVGVV